MTICTVQKDHFIIRVYNTMYLDYGLEIINTKMVISGDPSEEDHMQCEPVEYKEGYEPFRNPHCLCSQVYGFKTKDSYDGEFDNATEDDLEDWNDADWQHAILEEADVLIEAYIDEGQW